jgi:P4 family phage/plasmid primase-like protien
MPADEPSVKELAWDLASELLEKEHFVTLNDTEQLFRYEEAEGIYKDDGESYVKQLVEQSIESKEEISTHLVNEVLGHIKRSTFKPREIFDSSSRNPHLVVQNGLLNLETFELEPFTPEYFSLNKLNVKYDPSKDCPNFKQFLSEILSPEDIEGVQEEIGAILYQRYLTKKLSIYLGDTDTGKTTLMTVLLAFLGKENVSDVPLQDLSTQNRFAVAQLFGKMANLADELPSDVIKSIDRIKNLTGGFRVQGEFKFQNPFTFQNHAYLISACNYLPPVEQDDRAFWNRINLRNFTKKYGGKPKPDDPKELQAKLTTPDELSGILNWGLEGLKRLKANGWRFSNAKSLEEVRESYKRKSDPVWAFLNEYVIEDFEAVVSKEDLWNAFRKYCKQESIPMISRDLFFKTVPEKVKVTSEYRKVGRSGKQKHCFIGIVLNGKGKNLILDQQKGAYVAYPAFLNPSNLLDHMQPMQPMQGSPDLSVVFSSSNDNSNDPGSHGSQGSTYSYGHFSEEKQKQDRESVQGVQGFSYLSGTFPDMEKQKHHQQQDFCTRCGRQPALSYVRPEGVFTYCDECASKYLDKL